jgi:hypothetical protein
VTPVVCCHVLSVVVPGVEGSNSIADIAHPTY